MARTREAVGYLVVEDRRPRRWTQDGNAVISRVYASRPDRGTIPANAIIVPIRLVLSGALFEPDPVIVEVEQTDTVRAEVTT